MSSSRSVPVRSCFVHALIATCLSLGLLASPASATYPGAANGRLAFGVGHDGNVDIYSAMPGGQGLRRLTDDPAFEACPAYSADGRWIAYCSSQDSPPGVSEIWTMRQNGTHKRQVTRLGGFSNFPDFSPDGRTIAFNIGFKGSIATVSRDGSDFRMLTSQGDNRYAAWSPDGRRIAFLSDRSGVFQVWIMNADGSDQQQLTFDPAPKTQVPDWNPDGSRIAYVAEPHAPGGDIWVMDSDGTNPHQLTFGPAKLGAAWSPDGTRIATLDITTRTVEVLDPATGALMPVAPFGIQFVPAWQPRGTGRS